MDSPDLDISFGVQRNRVYDRELDLWIPYNSPCDALLASLGIVHKLSSSVVNTVLAIVNHPQFSNGRPTLKNSGDIYSRVADYRQENAVQRFPANTTSANMSPCTTFPLVILDLVIDEVKRPIPELQQRRNRVMALQQVVLRSELSSNVELLKTMSLVHRSWTRPAQAALGRWLNVVPGAVTLLPRRALSSPLFGPWTRELVCNHNGRNGENELLCLLPFILKKAPNLHAMSMQISVKRYNKIANVDAPSFLTSMIQLIYLRDLRLDIYPMSPTVLAAIFQALPRFTALSNLVLSLRSYGNRSDSMALFDKVTSGGNLYLPSLRTLSISMHTPREYTLTAINKLLDTATSPLLEQLFLEVTHSFGNSDSNAEFHRIIDASEESLGRLTTISVIIRTSHVVWDLVVPKLFACARSVKQLCVITNSNSYVTLEALHSLPKSIEELVILFLTWQIRWGSHDEELRMFITEGKYTNLRKLSVGYSYEYSSEEEFDDEEEERMEAAFKMGETATACEAKNVIFTKWNGVDDTAFIRDWY